MKATLWLQLLSLTILVSCSSQANKSKKSQDDHLSDSSVSLERDFGFSQSPRPELERKAGEGIYGPVPGEKVDDFEYATKATKLIPVTGLYLGPGLMRSSLHVNVLKALKYHGIQVHVISGMGLGAALATMFAFGLTPDLIEWRIFRFTNAVEGLRPLSKRWKESLDQILLEGLAEKKIEQANITLAIPLFDTKTSEVILVTRGNVRTLIEKQFEFSATSASTKYLSPMLGNNNIQNLLQGQGVDLSFVINSIGEKLRFDEANNYLAGIYGRIMAAGPVNTEGHGKVLNLPTSNMSLDSAKNVDKEIEKSLKVITELVAQLKLQIKEWRFNTGDSQSINSDPRVFDQHFLIREND